MQQNFRNQFRLLSISSNQLWEETLHWFISRDGASICVSFVLPTRRRRSRVDDGLFLDLRLVGGMRWAGSRPPLEWYLVWVGERHSNGSGFSWMLRTSRFSIHNHSLSRILWRPWTDSSATFFYCKGIETPAPKRTKYYLHHITSWVIPHAIPATAIMILIRLYVPRTEVDVWVCLGLGIALPLSGYHHKST
jgi:hypothetical protein